MISRREYLEHHWLAYTMCEEDFLKILEYVALRPSNYQTSSEKLIRSLLTCCEMFESLMKQMYEDELEEKKRPTIHHYMKAIKEDSDFDVEQAVVLKRGVDLHGLKPFAETEQGVPRWWRAHNDVKHNHSTNFEKGNLENALCALSALYLSNLVFARKVGCYWKEKGITEDRADIDVPNDISHLFDCPEFVTRYRVASRDSYFAPTDEFLEYLGL